MNEKENVEILTTETFKTFMGAFSDVQNLILQAVERLEDGAAEQGKPPTPEGTDLQNTELKALRKDIQNLQLKLQMPVKSTTNKVQILLFPEQDRKLFYKVVFGRWLLYLLIMFGMKCLYLWSINWNNNNTVLEQQRLKSDSEGKAWQYLYHNGDRKTKRLMNDAYRKSNGMDK